MLHLHTCKTFLMDLEVLSDISNKLMEIELKNLKIKVTEIMCICFILEVIRQNIFFVKTQSVLNTALSNINFGISYRRKWE